MKNVKKLFIIFLLIFGIIISTSGCSFAGGVPKYNPKDPNPKPGLYRVGSLHHERRQSWVIHLDNGKILLYGYSTGGNKFKTTEIFDPSTGKFTYGEEQNYVPFSVVHLDDGRYLILGSSSPYAPRDKCLEIYDPNINKFIDTKVCIDDDNYCAGDASIYKLKNNNIALYKSRRLPLDKKKSEPKPFKPFKRGSTSVYDMYLYDIKNNKLSDKPIKKGEKGYVDIEILIKELEKENPILSFQNSNEFSMLQKIAHEKLGSYINRFIKLNDDKVLIIAKGCLDYGVPIDRIEQKKIKYSWFSPIYEYNLKDKTLIPLNQFTRFSEWKFVKGKNMILFYDFYIPWYGRKYENQDPKNVPYKDRMYRGSAAVKSKHAYVYVY
ncbi:kelch repeat-containing protein [Clostridium sp. CAG:768]|nr:kelch repeat-containing protein [Clostridium sp. CAG:768]